jgi:hypothetical protein
MKNRSTIVVTIYEPNDPAGAGVPPAPPRPAEGAQDRRMPEQPGQMGTDDQSQGMGTQAKEAGQRVGSVAKDEAGRVVGEAGRQAREMMDRTRTEVMAEAGSQQERVATRLRSAGDELSAMGDSVEEPGMATQLVRAAGERTRAIADWLGERDPQSLMEEVRTYARRRPGMFLAAAVVAGVALGRVTRAAIGNASDSNTDGSSPNSPGTMGQS